MRDDWGVYTDLADKIEHLMARLQYLESEFAAVNELNHMRRSDRWPLDLAFKHDLEREIYNLQARLSCDPDERADIQARIEEIKAQLGTVTPGDDTAGH